MVRLFVSPQTATMSLYPSLEDMKVDQMGRVSTGVGVGMDEVCVIIVEK